MKKTLKIWLPKVGIQVQDDELWNTCYGDNPVFPEGYDKSDFICVIAETEIENEQN